MDEKVNYLLIGWAIIMSQTIHKIAAAKGRRATLWGIGHVVTMLLGMIPLPLIMILVAGYAKTKPLLDLLMTISSIAASIIFWWFLKTRASRVPVKAAPQPGISAVPLYYLYQGDAQSGPFTMADLRKMASAGAIRPDALYSFEGAADWQPIEKLQRMLRQRGTAK